MLREKKSYCKTRCGIREAFLIKAPITVLSVLLMLSLTGCGSKSASGSRSREPMMAETAMETTAMSSKSFAPAAGSYGIAGDSYYDEDAIEAEGAMAVAEAADYDDVARDGLTAVNKGEVDSEEVPDNRKLIRNVDLSFESDHFDEFLEDVQAKTKALGGYVEMSDISGNRETSSRRHANFTLRVPSAKLDQFLDFAEGAGNLTRKYEYTQDVTLQYSDLEARKKTLRTEQTRLLELLAQAESMDAVIALESRLSDIRYELESYESNLRLYDNQVQYSTVTMDISEKMIYSTNEKTGFLERISTGFRENLQDLGESIEDMAVFLIVNIPQIILWIIFIFLLVRFISFLRVRLALRKQKEKAALEKAMQRPSKKTGWLPGIFNKKGGQADGMPMNAGNSVPFSGAPMNAGNPVPPTGMPMNAGNSMPPTGMPMNAGNPMPPTGMPMNVGNPMPPTVAPMNMGNSVPPTGAPMSAGNSMPPTGMPMNAGNSVPPSGTEDVTSSSGSFASPDAQGKSAGTEAEGKLPD